MSDGWSWWASFDGGEYFPIGPCATREDAIDEAQADGCGQREIDGKWFDCFTVAEGRQDPLMLSNWILDDDELLQRADEQLSDSDRVCSEFDEGPYFECSGDQMADLGKRIKAACDEWQKAHNLTFTVHTFSAMRNMETVKIELPAEQAT